jgi:hypothetical protein
MESSIAGQPRVEVFRILFEPIGGGTGVCPTLGFIPA